MQQALGLLGGWLGAREMRDGRGGHCAAGPGTAGGWLGARKMCDAHRRAVCSRPWDCCGVDVGEANV